LRRAGAGRDGRRLHPDRHQFRQCGADAAQVVDPEPQYDNPVPTTDAAKSAAAVERYRTDRVKKPDTISTTDGQSGSPQ